MTGRAKTREHTRFAAMNASPHEPVLLSVRHGTALRLTLNRPRARNALSSGLMTALQATLDGTARTKLCG